MSKPRAPRAKSVKAKKRKTPKEKQPTFVLELPLVANPHESRVLAVRFEAGRQLYNAVLGEALRRLGLMKQSRAWQAARKMPKGTPGSPEQKARASEFSLISKTIGFTDYDLQAYATQCKNACWIGDHAGESGVRCGASCEGRAVARQLWHSCQRQSGSFSKRCRGGGRFRML